MAKQVIFIFVVIAACELQLLGAVEWREKKMEINSNYMEDVVFDFLFENIGNDKVEIEKIRLCCGVKDQGKRAIMPQ